MIAVKTKHIGVYVTKHTKKSVNPIWPNYKLTQ